MLEKKKFPRGYYFKKLLQAQKEEKPSFTYKGRLFLAVKCKNNLFFYKEYKFKL